MLSFFFTNQHTDLSATYGYEAPDKWTLYENNKDVNPIQFYRPDRVVLEFLPKSKGVQTADPRYSFLGAGAGNPIWIVPINPRDPELLQLGVSGEQIAQGTFASYKETDPRVSNIIPFPWVKMNVVDVRGPGYFSGWQSDEFGNPTVWVATAPGGNTNPNLFFTGVGVHVDYNWAFTAPGDYEVDVQGSAFLPDMTPTSSDVVTYHFQVDDTEASVSSGHRAGALDSQVSSLAEVPAGPLSNAAGRVSFLTSSQLVTPNPASGSPAPAAVDQVFSGTGIDHGETWPSLVRQTPVSTEDGLGNSTLESGLLTDSTLSNF